MERPEDYESLTTLNISSKELTELPSWVNECKKLKNLNCSHNNITDLDNLPITLEILYCEYNLITNLDNLPPTLNRLHCEFNQITQLDSLPQTLEMLNCTNNKITQLDKLPKKVKGLSCFNNPLEYEFEHILENIRNYNNQNKSK